MLYLPKMSSKKYWLVFVYNADLKKAAFRMALFWPYMRSKRTLKPGR